MSNQVTISGKSWEVATKYTNNGMCISEFSVSVYDGKDKETQKSKYFNVNCKVFGLLAENVGNEVQKGDNVLITGRQTVESWDKEGVKQYKNVLIVDEIGKSISKFAGQGATNSSPGTKTDMSSFGTDVGEQEIPF